MLTSRPAAPSKPAHKFGAADCVVVFPPPSPSDTNPPLGPALLARAAATHGVRLEVLDLNMMHINRYRNGRVRRPYAALGDHGKDRPLLGEAAINLFESFGLDGEDTLHAPDTGNPVAGMHYSFDTLWRAIDKQLSAVSPLVQWVEKSLMTTRGWPPSVLGVSVMGPSQVFLGLLILKFAKLNWSSITTVIGGSHVTLLADEIRTDERYRKYVDHVLPGHSELELVELVSRINGDVEHPVPNGDSTQGPPFDYVPLFGESQLGLYPPDRLTLPLQFTRGCYYAKCTYCTYPVVEPVVTKLYAGQARGTMERLQDLHGISRFSIKDSLFTPAMLDRLSRAILEPPRLNVRWSVTTKVSRQLIELAPGLASAGLSTVELGVETIHPRGQRLFRKHAARKDVEDVVVSLAECGVVVIVNLIFGLPGESLAEAEEQLLWFHDLQQAGAPGMIDCSLNLLEIVRGSPLARERFADVRLASIAPWAYCYAWQAPGWRREFAPRLAAEEASRTLPRMAS